MRKKLPCARLIALIALLLLTAIHASPARSQGCDDGTGNIFNEVVLIGRKAIDTLPETGRVFALTDSGRCIGETLAKIAPPDGLALPLIVWNDDPITPEPDGLMLGETFRVYGQREWGQGDAFPLIYESTYEEDGIAYQIEAAFDTLTTALLDSLGLELSRLSTALDSTAVADSTQIAQLTAQNATLLNQRNNARDQRDQALADLAVQTAWADSLQGVIDTFPGADEIADLHQRVDSLAARNVELEADIAQANAQLSGYLRVVRYLIGRLFR